MDLLVYTDDVADMPDWLRRKVNVVPLYVRIGKETFSSAEMRGKRLLRILEAQPGDAMTSQPAPRDFIRAFEKGDGIYIGASSKLSGTVGVARLAARLVSTKIHVVDSLSASLGQGILVLRALQMVKQGLDPEDIVRKLEAEKKRLRVYLTIGSLDYLRASGRIGRAKHLIGKLLGVRPILSLESGEIVAKGVSRNPTKDLARLFPSKAWFGHVGALEDVKRLAEESRAEEYEIVGGGPVISVHLGPGSYGGSFMEGVDWFPSLDGREK